MGNIPDKVEADHAPAAPRGGGRVDQVGYALGEATHAYLLGGAQGTFTVVDDHGRTARGRPLQHRFRPRFVRCGPSGRVPGQGGGRRSASARRVHSGRPSTSPASTPPARATARLYQRVTAATPRSARVSGTSPSGPTPGACRSWSPSAARSRTTRPRTSPDLRKYGAVVNGPDGAADSPICRSPRARRNAPVRMNPSTGRGSRDADDLSSWPGNEPAIDFTSTALLAFSL